MENIEKLFDSNIGFYYRKYTRNIAPSLTSWVTDLQFCPDQGVSWDVGLSVLKRGTSQANWDESVAVFITKMIYRNLTTIFYSISGNIGSNPFGLLCVGSPMQSLDSLMLFLPVVGTCAKVHGYLETATDARSVTV